jgi:hypothetical protein
MRFHAHTLRTSIYIYIYIYIYIFIYTNYEIFILSHVSALGPPLGPCSALLCSCSALALLCSAFIPQTSVALGVLAVLLED